MNIKINKILCLKMHLPTKIVKEVQIKIKKLVMFKKHQIKIKIKHLLMITIQKMLLFKVKLSQLQTKILALNNKTTTTQ